MAQENHLGKGVLIGFITGGALGAALALQKSELNRMSTWTKLINILPKQKIKR
jgi:gas vesicle protein